jgi:bifunctional DNA primase/polymerase-like protein
MMINDATGYAAAFDDYHRRGWPVLPIPHGAKGPPPKSFTGRDGKTPSYADMHAWAEGNPDANVAIGLPPSVIGVDVDDYDGKNGAATLAEAERLWGKLPPSYRSTSRDDGVSAIRLYRIPEGVELRESVGPGVEIIQHHHRYVMCWPSIHPTTGQQYRWHAEIDGSAIDAPPPLEDIPELPTAWVQALSEPAHNGAELGAESAVDVRGCLTEG